MALDQAWLEVLGKMPHGIYVLTCRHGEDLNGMIASWVTQVSYAPPLILVAIHPNRYSHRLIEAGGSFALHLLGKDHPGMIHRFKGPDPAAKFDGLDWRPGKNGSPVLKGVLGFMDCVVVETYRPGNHTLYVGKVVDAALYAPGHPLSTLDYEKTYVGRD